MQRTRLSCFNAPGIPKAFVKRFKDQIAGLETIEQERAVGVKIALEYYQHLFERQNALNTKVSKPTIPFTFAGRFQQAKQSILEENIKAEKLNAAAEIKREAIINDYNKRIDALTGESIKPDDKIISIVAPKEILKSIALNKAGLIVKTDNGYIINNEKEPYDRTGRIIGGTFPVGNKTTSVSTTVGDRVHDVAEDFFHGAVRTADKYSMNEESLNTIHNFLKNVQSNFVNGETVIGLNTVVFHTFPNGRKIAGEIDMITQDLSGNIRIYDFKTSQDAFTEKNWNKQKTGNGIKRSKAEQYHTQLSVYSRLFEAMTGITPTDMIIIPMMISYEDMSTAKETIVDINNVFPGKVKSFGAQLVNDIDKYIPQIGAEPDEQAETVGDAPPIVHDDDGSTVIGRSTEYPGNTSMMNDVVPIIDDLNPKTLSQAVRLIYKDPARMRNYAHSVVMQNAAEDYVSDLITGIMFNNTQINENKSLSRKEILTQVKSRIKKDMQDRESKIYHKFQMVKGNMMKFSPAETEIHRQQLDDLGRVNEYLDYIETKEADSKDGGNRTEESKDFVGYFNLAAMNANANKLINIKFLDDNNDEGSDIADDTIDDAFKYATRFVENYAFKLNPKASITVDTKIMLTQMREMERVQKQDDSYGFYTVYNRFGTPRNYALSTVINELHIDFEGVAPERFRDMVEVLTDTTPIMHSVIETINLLGKTQDKRDQMFNKLSSIIKQHRKQLFLNIDLADPADKKQKTKVIISDAARQGITENIIQQFQTRFIAQFNNLFDVKEIQPVSEQDQSTFNAVPKKQQVNYAKKGEKHKTYDFVLPENWNSNTYPISKLYSSIFAQLKKATASGERILLNMKFNRDSNLVIGNTEVEDLTVSDMLAFTALFDMDNIVFPAAMKGEITAATAGKNSFKFAETKMEQIAENLRYLLKREGNVTGDESTQKAFRDYDPVIYKMMASQLERIGIQLAENPEDSYLVLADLNAFKENSTNRKKFMTYDAKAQTFSAFLLDKIETLTIKPLIKPGAFDIDVTYATDEEGNINGNAKLNIEDPLSRARRGVGPLALHARSQWISYANSTIRNANGDLEYTYNPHNTLSLLMNKLKDPNTGFLDDLLQTPFGKHNLFIQSLKNPETLADFRMNYIDGGAINKFRKITPENITQGVDNLVGWNVYFNNEGSGANRNKGYYITTHGDNTVMPAFLSEKDTVNMDMHEYTDNDGNTQYRIQLNKTDEDGLLINPIYDKMYGILRGELERVAQSFRIFKDIMKENAETRIEYAYENNYTQGKHFKIGLDKNGIHTVIAPGNGINIYFGGSNIFNKIKDTGIYNADKTNLHEDLVDHAGNVYENVAAEKLDTLMQNVINDIVDDAYKGMRDLEGTFYTNSIRNLKSTNDAKSGLVSINYPYMNGDSIEGVTKMFENNAWVIRDGNRISSRNLEQYVERTYSESWLTDEDHYPTILNRVLGEAKAAEVNLEGITEEEMNKYREAFLQDADRQREIDKKTATRAEAMFKYMVADRTLNEYVFRSNIYQMAFDPASVSKSGDFMEFWYDFTKRNTVMLAPGDPSLGRHPVQVIGFKDNLIGNNYVAYTEDEYMAMDESEMNFLMEFKAMHPTLMRGEKFPTQLIEYNANYQAIPASDVKERQKFLKDVLPGKLASVQTTDAASFNTAREEFYNMHSTGKISTEEYFKLVNHFYKGEEIQKSLLNKVKGIVSKTVYAGPNIHEHNNGDKSVEVEYIKHAQFALIKGVTVFKGEPNYRIMEMMEVREAEMMQQYSDKEVVPGVIAVPNSAWKLGFTSDASLYDEDGNPTEDMLTAPIKELDRAFFRQQIESSVKDTERGTMSSQADRFKGMNIPGIWRFGRNGKITFSKGKEKIDDMTDLEKEEIGLAGEDNFKDGLSHNQMETISYQMKQNIALKKMRLLSSKMGFSFDEKGLNYSIRDIDKFIDNIVQHAVDQYGMSSNSAAYLATLPEEARAKWPVTFANNNAIFQSVILSELGKVFHKYTLPGGAYAQVPSTGLQKNTELKSYRVITNTKTFEDESAIRRVLNEEEIISRTVNKDNTITVKYHTSVPGEAMIVWNFRDADNNLLPYKQFIDENGYIKTKKLADGTVVSMIDDDMLDIIVNRIPNTGLNTMAKLKVARFFPEGTSDAIAMSPVIVDIFNADFDYDKLFTYVYNHELDENGRLVKQKSVIHYTQNNIGGFLTSQNSRQGFARNYLIANNKVYAALAAEVEEIDNLLAAATGEGIDTSTMLKTKSEDTVLQMKTMEAEFMSSPEFVKQFDQGNIYDRQTTPQLENGVLDIYHITLGDYKSLKSSTEFLTPDWLHNQIQKEVTVSDGEKITIEQLYEKGKYYNISSWWSSSQARVANGDAGKSVGIFANVLTTAALAQKYGLSYNSKHKRFSDTKENIDFYNEHKDMDAYELQDLKIDPSRIINPESNPHWMYGVYFSKKDGTVKNEKDDDQSSFKEDNKAYSHPGSDNGAYSAHVFNKNVGEIYRFPTHGRYRYDRIYTINNKGERVNITSTIQAILQAFLDFKNEPVRGYQNINGKTSNALMQMLLTGYTDEAPLLLMQQSVQSYVDKINKTNSVEANEKVFYEEQQIKTISEITGQSESALTFRYKRLLKGSGRDNMFFFITDIIKGFNNGEVSPKALALNEERLLQMLPMQLNKDSRDTPYKVDQLKALRIFLLADKYGKDLFTVQQALNSDSKGAPNSLIGLDIKKKSVEKLFNVYDKEFKSSAPSVAGLHRIMPTWAKTVKASSFDNKRANWVPGTSAFTYYYGLKPIYNLLSNTSSSNLFYEFSPLFRGMQKAFGAAIGKNISDINASEQERILRKLNVNFVSFIYSNPDIYRDFFPAGKAGEEEFKYFKEYGQRHLSLPDSSLPVNENFTIFDKIESMAVTLKNIADQVDDTSKEKIPYRNEYDILNALLPVLNTTAKSVSSVILPANMRYKEGINKLHVSLAAMYESGNPMLQNAVKKLILYSFMSGGVTTPNSFVQFLPPYLLSKLGIDTRLNRTLQSLTKGGKADGSLSNIAGKTVKSFMLQFLQHNRFEMKDNVDVKSLIKHDPDPKDKDALPSVFAYDKELGRMIIEFRKDAKPKGNPGVVKFDGRLFIKLAARNRTMYQEVDYAGMSRFHRNEYTYNSAFQAIRSLFSGNRSKGSKGYVQGISEVDGEINEVTSDEDQELITLYRDAETPFVNKLNYFVKQGTVNTLDMLTGLQLETASPNGGVFKLMNSLAEQMEPTPTVKFVEDLPSGARQFINYDDNVITVNIKHPAYGYGTDFNLKLFSDDIAHEVSHLGTGTAIHMFYDMGKKLATKNEALYSAVGRLVKLKELSIKALENDTRLKSEMADFKRWKKIVEDTNAGKQITEEDRLFSVENNYLRALLDTDANLNSHKNKEKAQMLEFGAYMGSSEKLFALMNKISFKEGKTNTTFWQKVKEILADILTALGFGSEQQTEKDLKKIKRSFTPDVKSARIGSDGELEQYFMKGDLSENIKNIKGYSALHAGLMNILDIQRLSLDQVQRESNSSFVGESKMVDIYQDNNPVNLDKMYNNVENYSSAWPDEIKLLYHEAAGNGSIIC